MGWRQPRLRQPEKDATGVTVWYDQLRAQYQPNRDQTLLCVRQMLSAED
jgi:hypothetical protein